MADDVTETSFPGPAPPSAPALKAVTCPSCGGSIAIRAAGYSVTLVCQYCGSTLDVANPDVRLITQLSQAASHLDLPLGAHGVLQGLELEVLGYMRRSIAGDAWEEYLLFNPYEGFRWLVRDEGDWSLGVMLTTLPKHEAGSEVTYAGRRFRRQDAPSEARVDYVLGEFYWRVQVGEKVTAETYEGHGADLSCERNADETNWTLITPLGGDVVAAFGGRHPGAVAGAPTAAPSGPVSTSGAKARFGSAPHLFLVGGAATLLLFVLMIAFSGGAPAQTMRFNVTPDGASRTLTVGKITLPRASQRVTLTSRSSQFENMWIDMDYSLIERRTQKRLDVSGSIEHYSGVDSDGRWTEGSYENRVTVASVPKGVYDVVVEASAHRWSENGSSPSTSTPQAGWDATGAATNDLAVEVTSASGGAFLGNFWVALLLIFLPPGVRLLYEMRSRK